MVKLRGYGFLGILVYWMAMRFVAYCRGAWRYQGSSSEDCWSSSWKKNLGSGFAHNLLDLEAQ